ncbi:hypothetical protein AI2623V1_4886 [Klebsiella oxytoca]|nr:hypothetical protein AI2623V1_4886 [Klebsiella oxytoca]CAH5356360.1 hypothetical protein AI2623V1_4886 [Klebsiella oxytoca]
MRSELIRGNPLFSVKQDAMIDHITTHLLIAILTEVKFAPTSLCYTDRLCIPEFLCMLPVPPYLILLFNSGLRFWILIFAGS